MTNRYVIALNRIKIAKNQSTENHNYGVGSKLSLCEVAKLMDMVRKYPEEKIESDNLFTCGFSMN